MSDFFSRWSRRKQDRREGKEAGPDPKSDSAGAEREPGQTPASQAGESVAVPAPEPQLPTLEEARALTPESDFSRFTGADVTPEVKNAAMKKLFSDPRFNVMDGLDVYIDDYSKPDPIPPEMLRQLASAKFLNLFGEEERAKETSGTAQEREVADDPAAQSMAQSSAPPKTEPTPTDNADPDLRLQQDHAAEGPDAGRGTG